MPTATRRKPDALTRLAELEGKQAEAKANADTLGRELGTRGRRLAELLEQRRQLAHRDPELITHTGEPSDVPDNPIVAIDEQILENGDVDDLRARYDHATAITSRARQGVEEFVKQHFDAILDGLEPMGQQRADALNAALDGVNAALEEYIGYSQRLMGLAAAARRDTMVSALEHAGALRRDLRDRKLAAPELYHR